MKRKYCDYCDTLMTAGDNCDLKLIYPGAKKENIAQIQITIRVDKEFKIDICKKCVLFALTEETALRPKNLEW